jgi:DNA-binding response OmpR family regulator
MRPDTGTDEVTTSQHAERAGRAEARRPLVLVVEDERDLAGAIRYHLERRAGCDVRDVGSAEEALDVIAERPPDVALVDIGLPAMDGLELCRRITASRAGARVAVIVMSASNRETARARAALAGAAAFLEKPFAMRDLAASVRALVPGADRDPDSLSGMGTATADVEPPS